MDVQAQAAAFRRSRRALTVWGGLVPFHGLLYAGLSVLLALCSPSRLSAQPWRAAEFLAQAAPAWEAYYAKAAHLQGKIRTKATVGNKIVYDVSLEIKQAPQCAMLIRQDVGSARAPAPAQLSAVNPVYRFELGRKRSAAPWVITGLSKDRTIPHRADRPDPSVLNLVNGWVATPLAMYGIEADWPTLTGEADFVVLRASPNAVGNTKLFEVEFSRPASAPTAYPYRIRAGRVTFDPEHFWVMRSARFTLESAKRSGKQITRTVTTTYDYTYEDGFPVISKCVEIMDRPDKRGRLITESVYSLTLADVPENVFTLTAFGFPEPNWAASHRTRWFLWAAVGGLACIGAAVVLRRWVGRQTAS